MKPVGEQGTSETYREFGEQQGSETSPCFLAWGVGVAEDPDMVALIDTLPDGKRQPNLVFAAARWHGAEPGSYDGLRAFLQRRWDDVRATVLVRATQTNEVGRCATLLPALASLPGPLALLEVGASAGLCLYPDRYSYRYRNGVSVDPADGPSRVLLECATYGDPPLPHNLPEVVWRGGIDLNPLDVHDQDAMRWLETLVWPEHDDRRARLRAAIEVVRDEPPDLLRGDLVDELPRLLETVPAGATPVVFHSAVLAYLPEPRRERFVAMVRELPCVWVSNEGPRVLPQVEGIPEEQPPWGGAPFVLAVDGRAAAWTEGHGRALQWL